MTMTQRLYELFIMALVWIPVVVLALLCVAKVEDLTENGAYLLIAVLVAVGFIGTEFALSAAGVDTSYAPE